VPEIANGWYTIEQSWRHAQTNEKNGNKCADVGAVLQQVDGNTGGGKAGWVKNEALSTRKTENPDV